MSEELDIQKSGKKIGKNIIKVAVSNLFTILAGVLVGFIIPKMMGTTDYGYYKIFTLYIFYYKIKIYATDLNTDKTIYNML